MDEAIESEPRCAGQTTRASGLQFDGLRARDVWALNKYFEQLPVVP